MEAWEAIEVLKNMARDTQVTLTFPGNLRSIPGGSYEDFTPAKYLNIEEIIQKFDYTT